ncbi:hypothetical protein EGT74_00010 [Chitinophaga lutea]|uniref:Uncharacterized protein n=1 Tax=Chitinophaga lutea TaxID=2488634 RepID=A0A3N4PYL8_9BACT|nr:hypothetical protein [Chitinophaga lutea]RPE11979.1 hypothetical protein EGT74_00010 [Chitinophaga lutea]
MNIVNILLILPLSLMAPIENWHLQKSQVYQSNEKKANHLYLATKNHLYFDSTKIKIISILPNSDVEASIRPGFLDLKPHKVGAGSFRVKTNHGDKTVFFHTHLLPEKTNEANKIISKKRALIID